MIILSELTYDVKQADGRFSVRERHVADDGQEFLNDYMCDADFDKQAKLAMNRAGLDEMLAAQAVEGEYGVG